MPSPAPEHEGEVIDLKILSPSSEAANGIHFPQLPVTTTVGELKLRIRDKLPTHPESGRQRLIYRGRVVGNNGDNMIAVFGASALQDSKLQTLHLVLRDPEGSEARLPTAPRSSTVSPNPFRPDSTAASSPTQTNPFRTPQSPDPLQSRTPPVQPNTPAQHAQHLPTPFPMPNNLPHVAQGIPGVPPLPPGMPPQVRHLMEQQQLDVQRLLHGRRQPSPHRTAVAQGAAQDGNRYTQLQPGQDAGTGDATAPQAAGEAESMLQAGQPPIAQLIAGGAPHRRVASAENLERSASQPASQPRASTPSQRTVASGSSHTINGVGPNGEHFTMTYNNSTLPMGATGLGDRVPTPQQLLRTLMPQHPLNAGTSLPGEATSGTQPVSGHATPSTRSPADPASNLQYLTSRLEHTERELSNIRNMLGNGNNGSNTALPGLGTSAMPMQRLASMQQYERLRLNARDLGNILGDMTNSLRQLAVNDIGPVPGIPTGGPTGNNTVSELRGFADRLRTEARTLELRINNIVFNAANSPAFNQMPRSASPAGRISSQIASRVASRVPSPAPRERTSLLAQAPTNQTVELRSPSQAPMVYLLSSPEGPQALLFSDNGTFTTANPAQYQQSLGQVPFTSSSSAIISDTSGTTTTTLPPAPHTSTHQPTPSHRGASRTPQPSSSAPPQQQQQHNEQQRQRNFAIPPPPPAPPQRPNHPAAGPANNNDNPAGAAAAGNPLALLGNLAFALPHIWVLARVLGFMYLFSNSSSSLDWPRLVLYALAALAFTLYHTGFFLFGGLGEQWGQQLRQRLERLLADDGEAEAETETEEADAEPRSQGDADADADTRGSNVSPNSSSTSTTSAQAQAQAQVQGRWRASLRATERLAAMFMASLWPGVGERHLAARESARRALEQRRQRQQERRQQQQQQQEQQEGAERRQRVGTIEDVRGNGGGDGEGNDADHEGLRRRTRDAAAAAAA